MQKINQTMKKYMCRLAHAIKNSTVDVIDHNGIEYAGYISFLMMISVFPFLIFFVGIVGVLGDAQLKDVLVNLILESPWAQFIESLKPRILEITQGPPQSLLTVAIISTVWTASSIFEGLRGILNKAYRVDSPPAYVLRRMLSIVEFTILVFAILLFVFILILLPGIINMLHGQVWARYIPFILNPETHYIRMLITLTFGFLVLSNLYYMLPNTSMKYSQSWPGTILVMFGWSLASHTLKWYISSFQQINLIYGSITSIIITLIFFYICSIIFIFGAEFNYHIANSNKSC